MTTFDQLALLLIVLWLALIFARYRRSIIAVIIGLPVVAIFTAFGLASGEVTFAELGVVTPIPMALTVGYSLVALAFMLAYSPVADRLATRFFKEPPDLSAFKRIQQSEANLPGGIAGALGSRSTPRRADCPRNRSDCSSGIVKRLVRKYDFCCLSNPHRGRWSRSHASVSRSSGSGYYHLAFNPLRDSLCREWRQSVDRHSLPRSV